MTFKVTLRPSGHAYSAEEGVSILSAGLAAGYSLAYSCRAGVCRTCKCKVVQGEIDHGDVLQAYLPDSERREGYALICQARASSDVVIEAHELSGLAGNRPRVMPSRVTKLERLASDVVVLRVRLPMNENFLFAAGQYVDILLTDGERRTYSIASAPRAEGVTELEFHLRRMPGGLFTDRVFSAMKVRDLLTLEGPLGTFFVRDSDKPMIFIAGGTGFAPIKSMLLNAFARHIHEKRPIHFYWGARTREGLYMLEVVNEWTEHYPDFTFVPVISDPTPGCGWAGRTGYVHQAVLDDHADLSGREVYVCGAPGLVEAARSDFVTSRNLAPQDFFADEFLPASDRRTAIQPLVEPLS
ncbi:CDP-4-dehydro-6-deoxyglucose reductase [Paraburkholderia sp. BL23I1N1]|uniref:CDP-6-deoxy-delta-3,4-glucoseen reductase n=1 Tax=Paraburkholderia sp. BL23I1N1 TaxID=1938802 RepID=UPI000E76F686|nr:CDP-6-deoxy-delta-3,4-glucoseen reductase [Paraburkholderia sp. BL23I1N1]RKE38646.1 CDP-4-dehydro-6-deoxyglucose reductase [Paraburkholderia sp. BL23I1N1]